MLRNLVSSVVVDGRQIIPSVCEGGSLSSDMDSLLDLLSDVSRCLESCQFRGRFWTHVL